MGTFILALLACLNATVADRNFRKGNLVFGTVAALACAYSAWLVAKNLGIA